MQSLERNTIKVSPFFRKIFWIAFICFFLSIIAFSTWIILVNQEAKKDFPKILEIYDSLLLNPQNNKFRKDLTYQDFPPALIKTLVAIEDPRFFEHKGVDYHKIMRGMESFCARGEIRGINTLTMSLTRNIYSPLRGGRNGNNIKIEFLLPPFIEEKYSKEQILTLYMNNVNFYGNKYGIEAASEELFECKTSDLNLKQIALIIGMMKGQGFYNPFRYPERAIERRNYILNIMAEQQIYPPKWKDSLQKMPLGLREIILE